MAYIFFFAKFTRRIKEERHYLALFFLFLSDEVELKIPEDALRSSATTGKCRCSKAKVLSITDLDGSEVNVEYAVSKKDSGFFYKVGEVVSVNDFDTNRWKECSTGIHFFMTREEAIKYNY